MFFFCLHCSSFYFSTCQAKFYCQTIEKHSSCASTTRLIFNFYCCLLLQIHLRNAYVYLCMSGLKTYLWRLKLFWTVLSPDFIPQRIVRSLTIFKRTEFSCCTKRVSGEYWYRCRTISIFTLLCSHLSLPAILFALPLTNKQYKKPAKVVKLDFIERRYLY